MCNVPTRNHAACLTTLLIQPCATPLLLHGGEARHTPPDGETTASSRNNTADTAAFQRLNTIHMFSSELRRKYGDRIFRAVSREICLQPKPGEELPQSVRDRAEQMAQSARTVLSGMDFFTRMQLSPALRTPTFIQACIELGIRPSTVSQAQCDAAQQELEQRFDAAADTGESPVPLALGTQWLKQALRNAVRPD